MDNPVDAYWNIRLDACRKALENNNFTARVVQTAQEARQLILDEFLPGANAKTVSWGGSQSLAQSGVIEAIKASGNYEVIDTTDKSVPREETMERRRQALLVDCFLTGTNAVTDTGWLVNLDMIGNRVCGLNFGPRCAIVLVGRNKLVGDLDEAMIRIKTYAAPANAMRLDKKTPCALTGACMDCNSPDRICNVWTITERSFPAKRIAVALVNQDLGL